MGVSAGGSVSQVTSDEVGHLVDCCSQQTLAIVLVLGSIYCSMYDIVLMNMVFLLRLWTFPMLCSGYFVV